MAEDGLVDGLVQVSFMTTAVLSRVAAAHDLSLTQLRVLAILRDRRLRMTVLADYLGLEKSTLSGLVDRAERRGLVRRAPSEDDRRAVDVLLAPDGVALASAVTQEVERALAPLLAPLDARQRNRLTAALTPLLADPRD